MSVPRDLNALLGSRICHDLISPLGAIGNGVELLAMSGVTAAPEIALISESVDNANARIRFFRVAFGAAVPGQIMDGADVQAILRDLGRGGRVRHDWQALGDLPREAVKLALLLVQCVETAMPWGGTITARLEAGRWRVEGLAEKLKIETELWSLIADPQAAVDVSASHVEFPLVAEAARASGLRLEIEIGETSITAR
ncbi:MAG: histidine phosphotransferase, partial [Rhodobacteraceae bacterium]|nr:histidine phosphotransferase [Paracoccaceae bacterium]